MNGHSGDPFGIPIIAVPSRAHDASRTLAEVEGEHIQRVLDSVGGNKTRAAEILGIDRKTLRAKLERHASGDRH